jgi:hypothetical protein
VTTIEAPHVFEENEMLTMGAMEGFHINPCFKARLEGRLARSPQDSRPSLRPNRLPEELFRWRNVP